jgi:hypothetical protein
MHEEPNKLSATSLICSLEFLGLKYAIEKAKTIPSTLWQVHSEEVATITDV